MYDVVSGMFETPQRELRRRPSRPQPRADQRARQVLGPYPAWRPRPARRLRRARQEDQRGGDQMAEAEAAAAEQQKRKDEILAVMPDFAPPRVRPVGDHPAYAGDGLPRGSTHPGLVAPGVGPGLRRKSRCPPRPGVGAALPHADHVGEDQGPRRHRVGRGQRLARRRAGQPGQDFNTKAYRAENAVSRNHPARCSSNCTVATNSTAIDLTVATNYMAPVARCHRQTRGPPARLSYQLRQGHSNARGSLSYPGISDLPGQEVL
jgi:hypothetical protein